MQIEFILEIVLKFYLTLLKVVSGVCQTKILNILRQKAQACLKILKFLRSYFEVNFVVPKKFKLKDKNNDTLTNYYVQENRHNGLLRLLFLCLLDA